MSPMSQGVIEVVIGQETWREMCEKPATFFPVIDKDRCQVTQFILTINTSISFEKMYDIRIWKRHVWNLSNIIYK